MEIKKIFEQHPYAERLYELNGNYYLSLTDEQMKFDYKVIEKEVEIKQTKNKK